MTTLNTSYIKRKNRINAIFHGIVLMATFFGVMMLFVLMGQIILKSWGWLNINFLTSLPSRFPKKAGIISALVGSIWVIAVTTGLALPIGVGTAIYLEKYAKQNRITQILQINISNLAGVPSIVYGILGLAVFVRMLKFERSILAGGFTLALLILPVIIVSSQEALKSVPKSVEEGSYALGMTKWQTITGVVLPYSLSGILTGTILAVSRAFGEAAPLIMIGAAGYMPFLPESIFSSFTTLPIQIFNWTSRPQKDFQHIASAGILVLMVILLCTNAIAIIIRNKNQNRYE